MNLGAKVDSSSTELRAFVKATSFFCDFRGRVFREEVYIVNLIYRFLEYYSNNWETTKQITAPQQRS